MQTYYYVSAVAQAQAAAILAANPNAARNSYGLVEIEPTDENDYAEIAEAVTTSEAQNTDAFYKARDGKASKDEMRPRINTCASAWLWAHEFADEVDVIFSRMVKRCDADVAIAQLWVRDFGQQYAAELAVRFNCTVEQFDMAYKHDITYVVNGHTFKA